LLNWASSENFKYVWLELILASLSTLTQEYRLLASTEEELHLDKQVLRRREVAEEAQLLANRLVEICHPPKTL